MNELKAKIYDLLIARENLNQELNRLQAELNRLQQEVKEPGKDEGHAQ